MEIIRCIPGYDGYVVDALETLREADEVIDCDAAVIARFLEKEENYFFAAVENGEVFGYAVVNRLRRPDQKRDMALLTDVRVAEKMRNKGIGTALVTAAKLTCSRDGMDTLFLTADVRNASMLAVMRKTGAIPTGKEFGAQFAFIL